MNDMMTFGGRIMIFGAVSALILAGVHAISTPLISGQRHKELESSLHSLIPEAAQFKTVPVSGNAPTYHAFDGKGQLKGYVLPASGKGYSSTIRALVAITPTGTVLGVTVLEQQETPGLGTRITEIKPGTEQPWFTAQFNGKKASGLKLKKDGGMIDSITGATITSRAMTDMVGTAVRSFTLSAKEHK